MLTKTPHLFDDATQVTAGDSRWQGQTSEDYWAFVGPFGGCTAATILRALIDHPQRAGDPLALTVNYLRAGRARRRSISTCAWSRPTARSQHWCVEMTQGGGEVSTLATAVFAERRPSWSHQQATFPGANAVRADAALPAGRRRPGSSSMISASSRASRSSAASPRAPVEAYSKLWIGDRVPRKIDMLSLMSMSDAFFGRVSSTPGGNWFRSARCR